MSQIFKTDDIFDAEWAEWYQMTPEQRWEETQKLWAFYLKVGGSLDPEPDTQSPFYAVFTPRSVPSNGRAGLRILRRGRV